MADEKTFFDDTESDYVLDRNVTTNHSVASRDSIRQQLQSQIEEFLAKGGHIAEIPANVRAEAPQRPDADDSIID